VRSRRPRRPHRPRRTHGGHIAEGTGTDSGEEAGPQAANPYGYNYCGRGSRVCDPKPDICAYFDCIGNFDNGKGYMIECADGKVSMSGGRQGSCSQHGGNRRTVYDG